MRKADIHIITLSHKHGEDFILTKDAPTKEQLKIMKKDYEKAHDIEIFDCHYHSYDYFNELMTTKETLIKLKNMC
mgnify:CR=1 FL=1|jgi:hypothetical protein|tara:strand:+ start:209 stop:433 length:225 start_codon:yes stop_codon:yes gene_type:complete